MAQFLLFFLGAVWLVGGIVLTCESFGARHDHPACRRCGYDLTGILVTAAVCPECGLELTSEVVMETGARFVRPVPLVCGLLMVLSAPGGCCLGSVLLGSP